ncbi:hypothetical protein AXF42_Ash012563 [Apostasia shenzhenica]|uniref:SMP-LTD domain-containing protein n=1 Tax=Apostasia shenzhenica TaxID=1088818 RepID=A0A2H9ZT09_9ASPA|nr:hypothetical protein AXF42_Ash012563 [Apostasia shenzhenica]
MTFFFALSFGFILGVIAVLVAECLAVYLVINRLRRKAAADPALEQPGEPWEPRDLDGEQWLLSARSKQGIVWLLEPEKIPKVLVNELQTKVSKDLKIKKGTIEVHPVKKHGKIKDRSLILSDTDGSQATINLLDCTVLAVSSSNLSSKKWSKRFPIKLESTCSTIYNRSKTCYLYLESAWEKESWCKALRIASSQDNKRINWYKQLFKEFNQYMTSFVAEFPSFLKPCVLPDETVGKAIRIDGSSSSSKVRVFFRKLAKKASKSGVEFRSTSAPSCKRDERTFKKSVFNSDVPSVEGSEKSSLDVKSSSSSYQDIMQLGNNGLFPVISDAVCDDKLLTDDGTLCWNLLLARLFFDAKKSAEINSFVKARIQKTLSNMRTPSYIGEVTCINLDLGNFPPYIHKITVLPMDINEVWAVEVDIEYLGGMILDIETRIEVCEPELQNEFINASSEPNHNGETSSLLEGIEYYSNQLAAGSLVDKLENSDEGGEIDCLKQTKSSSQAIGGKSKWKAILHSIADQVSQIPLSLAIKIASLRGTLRLHVRPPPSNQLWFGFTSIPEIDWQLESSIGERKITTSHIALLLGNRFKTAIRDSLVLPNCENICIPWMLAEKDDWVPRDAAPFVWNNQESIDTGTPAVDLNNPPGDLKTKSNDNIEKKTAPVQDPADKTEKIKDVVEVQPAPSHDHLRNLVSLQIKAETPRSISTDQSDTITAHSHQSFRASSNEELTVPLLRTDGIQESSSNGRVEPSVAPSVGSVAAMDEQQAALSSEEDLKPKRIGRRARMMDLGKKVSEKLEEKRRHIEEKSRHIVEKMRENAKS